MKIVTGAIGTAFFVWRRDLVANMIAHVTVDAMGIVIVPVLLGYGPAKAGHYVLIQSPIPNP